MVKTRRIINEKIKTQRIEEKKESGKGNVRIFYERSNIYFGYSRVSIERGLKQKEKTKKKEKIRDYKKKEQEKKINS